MSLAQGPEACSSLLFPEQMGLRKANEMLIGGHRMPAEEALKVGFANAVFKDSTSVKAAALEKAKHIAAYDYETVV